MKQTRLRPEIRKEEILAAALILASDRGYTLVTRGEVADMVGVSGPAIQYHFGTMSKLRCELMRYAVKQRHARVVAQGLATREQHAMRADDRLKREAMEAVL